ncbi:hypothetical protein SUGI_0573740 [Cryptomeria japonica]|nr:hypothetical protein SUGI_0573740 [Cryptomeria japonica]
MRCYTQRTKRYTMALPLVYVSTNKSSRHCLAGSLDPELVKGKVFVCNHPLSYNVVVKSNVVAKARGACVIVANKRLMGTRQQLMGPCKLSAITVSFTDGEKIKAYINSTTSNAKAALSIIGLIVLGNQIVAPMVDVFSSREPSLLPTRNKKITKRYG